MNEIRKKYSTVCVFFFYLSTTAADVVDSPGACEAPDIGVETKSHNWRQSLYKTKLFLLSSQNCWNFSFLAP